MGAIFAVVGLLAAACATPVAAPARSSVDPLRQPTATPVPPTPTPVPELTTDTGADDDPAPEPTPVAVPGLSDEEIRLASVIDPSTGGLGDHAFQSARQAVDAWVLAVNQRGGIGGRDVVVDHLGDQVTGSHADMLEAACAGDYFALVGSMSWTDGDGIGLINSDECTLPDFPAAATSLSRRTSQVTFVSNPTIDQFQVAALRNRLVVDSAAAADAMVLGVDSGLGAAETFRLYEAAEAVGYTFTSQERFQRLNAEAQFSNLGEYVLRDEPRSLLWAHDPGRLADLLVAIQELEEADPFDFIICVRGCYDQTFVDAVGDAGDNVFVSIPHLPFDEAGLDPSDLRDYLSWLNLSAPTSVPTSDGLAAWASGRLFEEAANRAINAGPNQDPDLLTPSAVVDAAETIEVWNARRIYADASPSFRQPSPCQVLLRLQESEWVRVSPVSEGTRDCELDNLVLLQATVDLAAPAAETSSITSGTVGTTDEPATGEVDPTDIGGDSADPLEQIEELPE